MSGKGSNQAGAHGEQPVIVNGHQQVPHDASEAGAGNGAGGDKGKGVADQAMVPTHPGSSAQGGSGAFVQLPSGVKVGDPFTLELLELLSSKLVTTTGTASPGEPVVRASPCWSKCCVITERQHS